MIGDVVIAGGAMTPFNRRKDGSSFRDWARAAALSALEDAGLEAADIDALVVASESDFFTMQLNPAALLADECGLTGVVAKRVEGGRCIWALGRACRARRGGKRHGAACDGLGR